MHLQYFPIHVQHLGQNEKLYNLHLCVSVNCGHFTQTSITFILIKWYVLSPNLSFTENLFALLHFQINFYYFLKRFLHNVKNVRFYYPCGDILSSRWQQVPVNKGVIAIEPNHLNGWFIQERNTVMWLRDAKQCCGCVWNYSCCWNRAKTGNMVSKTYVS